ncbi:unnamed protein product [Lasius platythorax]|uniref:Uncharacterized protein n=1 Tax=Lasius platythorax TaxID=488582 RepID=A0AAV2NII3_9HYME
MRKNPALRVLHRLEARAGIYTGSRGVRETRTVLPFHQRVCVCSFLLAGLRSKEGHKNVRLHNNDDISRHRVDACRRRRAALLLTSEEKEATNPELRKLLPKSSSSTEARAKEIPANK